MALTRAERRLLGRQGGLTTYRNDPEAARARLAAMRAKFREDLGPQGWALHMNRMQWAAQQKRKRIREAREARLKALREALERGQ